jgi:AcrR family transcriptional regulator
MAVANSRLTRDDWIGVARKALVTSGIDDVKVDVLARRIKVTRGSFYWHFESRQDLLNALLEDWETNNRREIDAIRSLVAMQGDALLELFRVWLGEDPSFPAFDIAIRVWARKAPAVARMVRKIDDAWIAVLQEQLERRGLTPPESFVRARIMYFHQVGYFAMSIQEDIADRAQLAPYYYTALTGMPAPAEMVEAMMALKPGKTRKTKQSVPRKSAAPAPTKPARRARAVKTPGRANATG